jgi:hypothetical protein
MTESFHGEFFEWQRSDSVRLQVAKKHITLRTAKESPQ